MLTLITLLPSDNEALLGRFNRFYDALLIPSDNVAILLSAKYCRHYIKYSFLLYFSIYYYCLLYFGIIYHKTIYQNNNLILRKMGFYMHTHVRPPPPHFF